MQADGNLVEYDGTAAAWASGTTAAGSSVAMQGDGNLVVYDSSQTPKWASNTSGNTRTPTSSSATTASSPSTPRPESHCGGHPLGRHPSRARRHLHQPDLRVDGGGTSVTINGSGFTGASAVEFGTDPAPSFTVNEGQKDHGSEPG